MGAKFTNKRDCVSSKKNLCCYTVNFMQTLMSIQYYVEPDNIPSESIQDEDKDTFDFK